jgi:ribosomal-protein-alanine N-acetyltransferase
VPLNEPLWTGRLRLEPVTEGVIAAAERGRGALEAVIGAIVHDDWRGDHVFERGRFLLTQHEPRHALVIHRDADVVIGDVRFEPQRGGGDGVEIGYEIVRDYRRQGFAVEAMEAVIEALKESGAPYLVAGCRMRNIASVRTLRKLAFTLDGSSARGDAFWWVRRLKR